MYAVDAAAVVDAVASAALIRVHTVTAIIAELRTHTQQRHTIKTYVDLALFSNQVAVFDVTKMQTTT